METAYKIFASILIITSCATTLSMKDYLSSQRARIMCTTLFNKINDAHFKPEAILAIVRGGVIPAGYLAGEGFLNNKNLFFISIESYDKTKQSEIKLRNFHKEDLKDFKSILIVDDIVDSGKTMEFTKGLLADIKDTVIKTAALYYKPSTATFKPDFYAAETSDWIVFPWETRDDCFVS